MKYGMFTALVLALNLVFLRRGEPITDEVLEAYGRDSVTLTKLTNGEYVVTF